MKTKIELEEQLPDYVFGRLDEENSKIFEENVVQYPDLLKEIEDVKSVFSKVEKMDFNNILDIKTRNLSVKVNNRLQKRKSNSSFGYIFKFAFPVAAVIAITIVLVQNFSVNNNKIDNKFEFSTKLNSTLNQYDFNSEELEDYNLPKIVEAQSTNIDSDSMFDFLSTSDEKTTSSFKKYSLNTIHNDFYLEDELENLTEDEFQNLIKDIDNVKI
jgi:hypothetical protein